MTGLGTFVVTSLGVACVLALARVVVHVGIRHWQEARGRVPPRVRHGTPRDGGRGTLAPTENVAAPRPVERNSALVCGTTTPSPKMVVIIKTLDGPIRVALEEWRASQAARRHETAEEAIRRAQALRGRRW